MLAVVSPVLHRYVPPPLAVRLTVGLAQVSVAEVGLMAAVLPGEQASPKHSIVTSPGPALDPPVLL